jgi:threonine synthase
MVTYDFAKLKNEGLENLCDDRPFLWRWKKLLPVMNDAHIVSLGEGDTPLIPFKDSVDFFGVNRVLIKDESRNPTWSHKDRMCSVLISKAIEFGAKVIAVSSTGNHGASAAAYAARAGLDCVVFTVSYTAPTMLTFMQAYGAKVIALQSSEERWQLLKECVEKYGWFTTSSYITPPVGNNPYGTDGYKTIAYEIWLQMDRTVPDVIIDPVSYGSTLFGIWKGFYDLKELGLIDRVPRLVAGERFGALENAMKKDLEFIEPVETKETVAISIACSLSGFYGLKSVRESSGMAVSVNDDEIISMQEKLGRRGMFYEASSVVSAVVLKKLVARGTINNDDTVVLIMTSSGLKDPSPIRQKSPEVPLVEPDLRKLKDIMSDVYDFKIE